MAFPSTVKIVPRMGSNKTHLDYFKLPDHKFTELRFRTSIRLLNLHATSGEDIYCSLEVIDLKDMPAFDALSYTWGNPLTPYSESSRRAFHRQSSDVERRFPIICDGQKLLVTANLRDALYRLRMIDYRATKMPRQAYLWIDALCIDQRNVQERNHQVALMGQIFKSARTVLIWVGEHDEFTSDALTLVDHLSQIPESLWDGIKLADFRTKGFCYKPGNPPLTHHHWLGFIAFINRPYFRRAWVVQEIALAKEALLICGSTIIPWNRMSRTLAFLKSTGWYHHLSTEKLKDINCVREDPGVYQGLLSSEASVGMAPLYLARTREEIVSTRHQSPRLRLRKPSLPRLLFTHRHTKASDPRDKIFAFLGLAGRQLQPAIQADYAMSVQDVYTHVAQRVLMFYHDLSLLSDVQDASCTAIRDLPSWVPDWSVSLNPSPLKSRGPCGWGACGTLDWRPNEPSLASGLLEVQGLRLDTIVQIATMPGDVADQGPLWVNVVEVALGLDERYLSTLERRRPIGSLPASTISSVARELLGGAGSCLKGLSFVVTGVPPNIGRQDVVQLIQRYGGKVLTYPTSRTSFAVLGAKAGPRKLSRIKELGLKALDERGLTKLIRTKLTKAAKNDTNVTKTGTQSRIEVLWRTLMADTFQRQHPAPAECGDLFIEYIIRLSANALAAQPHAGQSSDKLSHQWQSLLDAEPQDSPYRSVSINERLSSVAESIFDGTYTPSVGLSQLEHEFDRTTGRMRRLFRTQRKLLGAGARSLRPGDEVWILAGAQVPFILRRLANGNYQLVGEAYLHGCMHGELSIWGWSSRTFAFSKSCDRQLDNIKYVLKAR